ncbi:MAG: peptidoglycan DD-metalloendopeptidase family protein [Myxococcota bacterium]
MTIYRNPVDGANIPKRLPCIDLDPETGKRIGNACKAKWDVYEGSSFNCPNRSGSGRCSKAAFLYPRKRRSNGKDFHFHQGVDIGRTMGLPIRSVTAGKVLVAIDKWEGSWSHYGRIIVIESSTTPYYFLYAHCDTVLVSKGDIVKERQKIGTVGNTFFSKKYPTGTFSSAPHLHFEVLASMKSSYLRRETQLGEDLTREGGSDQPRLDPRYILEQLGPWGMSAVHVPTGGMLDRERADLLHETIESSPHGGFFPFGAHNHWHGGVHLPAPRGSKIVAPFDATIVAARLDPDPATAVTPDGSTNFILLRHQIPEPFYAQFQGDAPTEDPKKPGGAAKEKDRAVGLKTRCANLPDDVLVVKQRLHDKGYYKPSKEAHLVDPSPGSTLKKAITAFQEAEVDGIKPDGVIDIPGGSWTALHDGAPPEDPEPSEEPEPQPDTPTDPTRVVYSLIMHLDAVTIDAKLAKTIEWLKEVEMETDPSVPDPEEEEAKKAKKEHEEDVAEAEHTLSGAVGAPNKDGEEAANEPDDVTWVQKRLTRFEYFHGEIDGVCDEALVQAIRDLQNDHHNAFKNDDSGDGRVDTNGGTVGLLRQTKSQLFGGGGGGGGSVDPVFVHRTAIRNEHGTAQVITGLDIKVSSGDALWLSGQGAGYNADGTGTTLVDQVHWEIFSEHRIDTDWEEPIDDDTDDVTVDAVDKLLEFIEEGSPELEQDGILTPDEVRRFYASGRGEFLRWTPCRFVNQWSVDVSAAVKKLEEKGFDTDGLPERMWPFMWWNDAADELPSNRFVWHYNPVEFLARYSEFLAAAGPPEDIDPKTHPTLRVRVLFDNHMPMPNVEVELLYGIHVKRTVFTNDMGIARFPGVAVGEYGVRVVEPALAPVAVELKPDETTEIDIVTDEPGPPPPRGSIQVIVRKHTKTIAGDDIEVWLTHPAHGPITMDFTSKGKVWFENILQGEYGLEVGTADPVEITLDKKKKNITVVLPPPPGTLRLEVEIDKAPGARQTVTITKDGKDLANKETGEDGVVEFELLEGRYKAFIGKNKKSVRVNGHETMKYKWKLSAKDAPEPAPEEEEGRLSVILRNYYDGEPVTPAVVFVTNMLGSSPEVQQVDYDGVATFELPPGEYFIEAEGASASAGVGAWSTTWVELEVDYD